MTATGWLSSKALELPRLGTVLRTGAAAAQAGSEVAANSGRWVRLTEETAVGDVHGRLGIGGGQQSLEARRWADAAAEVRRRIAERPLRRRGDDDKRDDEE